MCGIIGIYALKEKHFLATRAHQANQTLLNRGPDGGAVFVDGKLALGHRRLSIIDTSCAGDQPMHSADGRFTIVFNGEIFNYKTLRDRLLTDAERSDLKSNSDTEVFLQLYTRLKEKTFELLQGFFAAAIYDNHTSELTLVRDRFGVKPLLYYQSDEVFIFGSEMKALLAAGVPRKMAWNLLPVYLQLNYVPQPYSLLDGVHKVQPGYYMKVQGTSVTEQAYYRLEVRRQDYDQFTYDEAKVKLVHLMDEAVRLRLISDVPLGAFLSGGIDSSVVVALAARHTKHLATFSVGYKDNSFFDETKYARLVADKYKTEHTVFSLGNNDFLEHIHDVLNYIDEPFADSSAIPVFILSKLTRRHVTVALSGDGGDEVFAGYNKHAAEWRMRQGGLLNTIVKTGAPLWERLPHSRANKLTNTFRQLHRFAQGARLSAADRYWQWASFNTPTVALGLLSSQTQSRINSEFVKNIAVKFTAGISGKDFNEVLLADMNLVLLSDMLTKVDLMSMANSLEIRSPFLDKDVVHFAFGLPTQYKIDGKLKKKIVQDAFRNHLPNELYNRPKQGFEIPLLDWFRKELWDLIDDDLLSEKFVQKQGVFNVSAVQSLKAQLKSSNPGDSHATIWSLIVFQHWWKRYMEG
mgnify:CR=1 FL=1